MLFLLLGACGLVDSGYHPIQEAHRAGAAYWPQNSRTAVLGTVESGFDAIEFDLVLTSDHIPVLSHDPWIHEDLCTTVDGASVTEEILIMNKTLAELDEGYVCGGVPDEEQPDAEVIGDTWMTMDELLVAVEDDPDLLVHLDIKYEPGKTQTADEFARIILDRWFASQLPNPWYITSNLPEAIIAFEDYGAELGQDVPSSYAWPRFTPDTSDVSVALSNELATTLGVREIVDLAAEAHADGLCIPWQVADRQQIQVARDEGLGVQIWTVNDQAMKDQLERWPIDSIITDSPVPTR